MSPQTMITLCLIGLLHTAGLMAVTPIFKDRQGDIGRSKGRFYQPTGVATYKESLFVVDQKNRRIQRVTSHLRPMYSFKAILDEDGRLDTMDTPFDVAVDPLGTVYVSDLDASRIYVFDFYGRYLRTLGAFGRGGGTKGVAFHGPHGLAVDSLGFLYVADTLNHRIVKVDDVGNSVMTIVASQGNLRFPRDVKVSVTGQIFVLDEEGIKSFNELGYFDETIASLNGAEAFERDHDGQFYVAFPTLNQVHILDKSGERLWRLDAFKSPQDLVRMGNDLYITEAHRHRIWRYHVE